MADRPIEELAKIIRTKVSERSAAEDPLKKQAVEGHIGEEVFCSIFAQDTTILGPWQLKTAGKRTDPKYREFKQKWDRLCSQEDLGVRPKDLTAWCRARALERLLAEKGLNPNDLNWQQLNEIQRLRAVNQMVEQARKAMQGRRPARADDPTVPTAGLEKQPPELTAPPSTSQPQSPSAEPPTLAELERLIESPSELLQRSAYVELLSNPAAFKEAPQHERERLLARVQVMARRLEMLARSYRDFEAVLRWSRRF